MSLISVCGLTAPGQRPGFRKRPKFGAAHLERTAASRSDGESPRKREELRGKAEGSARRRRRSSSDWRRARACAGLAERRPECLLANQSALFRGHQRDAVVGAGRRIERGRGQLVIGESSELEHQEDVVVEPLPHRPVHFVVRSGHPLLTGRTSRSRTFPNFPLSARDCLRADFRVFPPRAAWCAYQTTGDASSPRSNARN